MKHDKVFMSHKKKRIWVATTGEGDFIYMVAKGDGTDEYFSDWKDAMDYIDSRKDKGMHPGNKTSRETYSRIIGYNFGTDREGNDQIYNGAYWDPDTGKKQYEFLYYDRSGKLVGQYLTDYKGFREIIDCYDWPKR